MKIVVIKPVVAILAISSNLTSNAQEIKPSLNYSPWSVDFGFGIQQYQGDLGHGFYDFSETTYGVGIININYKINRQWEVSLRTTNGDLGYCQPDWKEAQFAAERAANGIAESDNHEHENPYEENLNSRLIAAIPSIRYNCRSHLKNSNWNPFVYAGIGVNRVTDIMKMGCVEPGIYMSRNWGGGVEYTFKHKWSVGAQFSFGQFFSDKLDFIDESHNDMYMQNSIVFRYRIPR